MTPEPQLVDTDLGPVQVARKGNGTPVLVVHGTPGGYDQAVAMAGFLPEDRFEAIMPSRPGFLGTDLAGRETIDQQADLHAALLDALGVERAGVLFWSGGGPSSYRLAVRHPDKVAALVGLAAVSKALVDYKDEIADRLMFTTAPGNWLLRALAKHAPKQLISSTLGSEGDLTKEQLKEQTEAVFADPVQRQFVLDLDASVTRRSDRSPGYDNDMEQFKAITSLELDRITAPTLLVWGSVDSDVPTDHDEFAANTIPGAESLVLDEGTHLAFYAHPEAERAQARALEVLAGA